MALVRGLILTAFWVLGLSCIQKCFLFWPAIESGPIAAPPILTDNATHSGWIIFWILLWGIAGILLIVGPFIGSKVIIFRSKEDNTQFRLDDLAFVLYSGLGMTWGLSYYGEWFLSLFTDTPSASYNAGAVYLGPAIFVFAVWAISFTTRAERGELTF